jgi:hypothetical protein
MRTIEPSFRGPRSGNRVHARERTVNYHRDRLKSRIAWGRVVLGQG